MASELIDPAVHRRRAAQERRGLDAFGRAGGGRARHRDRRRHRARLGSAARDGQRAPRVPRRPARVCLQPRRGRDRLHHLRRGRRYRGGRPGQADRPHPVGAGRRRVPRPGRRRPRPADRRQGSDRRRGRARARAAGAQRGVAPAGEGAALHGHHRDRRDDGDRPRPAPADHRRPPDRQDRGRARHDHQPEAVLGNRPGRALHLRGHRPEGLDGGRGRRDASRERRARVHGGGQRARPPTRRRSSTSPRTRARRSARTGWTTASTS